MTITPVFAGTTPNDGTGEGLRDGVIKLNANDAELDLRQVSSTADPTATDDTGDGYQAFKTLWLNSRTRNLFICTNHSTGAAVWQCLNPNQINLATNDFYTPFPQDYGTTGLCAQDVLRGVMFKPAQRMTVDKLGILTNATASVNWKAGLWAVSGVAATGSPLVTVASTSASTARPIQDLSAALTLDPAYWYFYADVHDGTLDKLTHQAIMNRFCGVTGTTLLTQGANNRGWHYSVAHPFANALPDLTAVTMSRVAALAGSQGPAVPYFRVSNVSPT